MVNREVTFVVGLVSWAILGFCCSSSMAMAAMVAAIDVLLLLGFVFQLSLAEDCGSFRRKEMGLNR